MMSNLFSMFDPSTSSMKMNWLSVIIPMMLIPNMLKNTNNKTTNTINLLMNFINTEMKTLQKNMMYQKMSLLLTSMFMTLMIMNLTALLPFCFTPTAHISITLSMSTIMWMSITNKSLVKNPYKTLIHMVPTGTPTPLMNFMVIIEMTSNIIRPITLSVRLSANMIAGHLLMGLLSQLSCKNFMLLTQSMPPLLILSTLELSVALIQSYVMVTLITLYKNET